MVGVWENKWSGCIEVGVGFYEWVYGSWSIQGVG